MGWASTTRRAGSLIGAVAVVALFPTVAQAKPAPLFTIKDSRVVESSGLAADQTSNLYWTVNDSGATGTVYGVQPDGAILGSLNFRAKPVDVEAVAFHDNLLYVADIGDNSAQRDFITVYYFANPRASGLTLNYRSFDFSYPEGAQDAETLLVDPAGRLFIVTKGISGAIYAAPKSPKSQGVNELERVGDAPATITDGTFLPDGKRIALLSYGEVIVIDARKYRTVATAKIPKQPQAESLTVSLDGKSLLVGSEGKKSKVYAMKVPGAATPTPTPSPADSPADSGGSDADATDADAANSGIANPGNLIALGLSGFVAIVAGVVVVLVRRS